MSQLWGPAGAWANVSGSGWPGIVLSRKLAGALAEPAGDPL